MVDSFGVRADVQLSLIPANEEANVMSGRCGATETFDYHVQHVSRQFHAETCHR